MVTCVTTVARRAEPSAGFVVEATSASCSGSAYAAALLNSENLALA